ncbi:MAG: RnfH family protein [Nitrosomonas sp. PRO4]|nr:RnfH family protein [Nitrosomonas sp. PRO4]
MANADRFFQVEVVYALHHVQILKKIAVSSNSTVEQAIKQSEIISQFPEIDLTKNKCGIFGKSVSLDTPLQPYDRIEIYRPLIINPKDARRIRAKKKIHA